MNIQINIIYIYFHVIIIITHIFQESKDETFIRLLLFEKDLE